MSSRTSSRNTLGLEARGADSFSIPTSATPGKKKTTMSKFLSKNFRLTELEDDEMEKEYEETLRNNNHSFNYDQKPTSEYTKANLQERVEMFENDHFSTSKYSWPIFLVILPPIISIFYGDTQTWSDLMLLALVGFYLFLVIKVPWELYFVARKRRVNMVSQAGMYMEPGNAAQEAIRFEAEKKLRRQEKLTLFIVIISPVLGGYLLNIFKDYLSQYDKYFSQLNIVIFIFAAGIKPIMYMASLLKKRALILQDEIHYPIGEVEGLKRRVGLLENELVQLKKAYVTKLEMGQVREGIEPALVQLSRVLQKYEKREQRIRARNEERFSNLEKRLREFESGEASSNGTTPHEKSKPSLLLFFVACFSRFVFLPLSIANNSLKLVKYLLPNSLNPISSTKSTPLIQNSDTG
ncbi:hypothetical protein K7432_007435 [Basidiobolus ranarum]|uniref:Uncharacterized protein n=1 Tax=Basidiobolus ranarum TaxID=34480 RepID=A0ABR2WTF1_9FUNG